MATLVQQARLSQFEMQVAKNAEVIVSELKKKFFEHLPQMISLVGELSKEYQGHIEIRFETNWFDSRFSPVETKSASMEAADEEFARWFKIMFGIDAVTYFKYRGDMDMSYEDGFSYYITSPPRPKRSWRIKRR